MNAEELAEIKRKLREFISANGMQWILDEADEAVSLGISEVRTLRQTTRQGRSIYEDITPKEVSNSSSGRRKRTEEFVSRRPMTELEQVELLVEALRRVLIVLDEIANESVEALNDPILRNRPKNPTLTNLENVQMLAPPQVERIAFVPDEGSSSPAIDTEAMRHADRSIRASEILAQVESLIRS